MSNDRAPFQQPASGDPVIAAFPPADSDLLSLIGHLCDGDATPEQCRTLEALLADPEALAIYCAVTELHSSLAWKFGDDLLAGGNPSLRACAWLDRLELHSVPSSGSEDRSGGSAAAFVAAAWSTVAQLAVWRWLAGAAARMTALVFRPALAVICFVVCPAILLVATLLVEMTFPERPARMRNVSWPTDAVAVLSGLRDAKPVPGGRPLRVAELVPIGSVIDLSGGLVEITYRCGATVVVKGPASFVVCGDRAAALNHGMLSAHVASARTGPGAWNPLSGYAEQEPLFSVYTPKGVVHDRGTEFGIAVAANGRTAVKVFSGIVDFVTTGVSKGQAVRLSVGEAAELADAGTIIKTADSPAGLSEPLPQLGTESIVAVPPAPDTILSALRYYQPCEDLVRRYAGESIHPNPTLEPGKIGMAFRIEDQSAVNLVTDGDMNGGQRSGWTAIGSPQWLDVDGRFDPACAAVDARNYLQQEVTEIMPDTLCCASVFARATPDSEGSVLRLSVRCGEMVADVASPPLTADFVRVVLPFRAKADVATLSLEASGDGRVIVDGAQLEANGRSFPRSFNPKTGGKLGGEWVDIPARKEIFDPNRGSIAFWTRPNWVGQSSPGSPFFTLFSAISTANQQRPKSLCGMMILARNNPDRAVARDSHHAITVSFTDRSGKVADYFVPLEGSFIPDAWAHVVVTWEVKPAGESSSSFYVNGRRVAERRFVIDGIGPPTNVRMGYGAGSYADGLMDEFCIFDRPLTDAEAAELAARTSLLVKRE
jgi:hypothetical protein